MFVTIGSAVLAASLSSAPLQRESFLTTAERVSAAITVMPATARGAASRLDGLGPLAGGIIGGAFMWKLVHEERDFSAAGRVMWIGIGTAVGAGAGWLIEKMIER